MYYKQINLLIKPKTKSFSVDHGLGRCGHQSEDDYSLVKREQNCSLSQRLHLTFVPLKKKSQISPSPWWNFLGFPLNWCHPFANLFCFSMKSSNTFILSLICDLVFKRTLSWDLRPWSKNQLPQEVSWRINKELLLLLAQSRHLGTWPSFSNSFFIQF